MTGRPGMLVKTPENVRAYQCIRVRFHGPTDTLDPRWTASIANGSGWRRTFTDANNDRQGPEANALRVAQVLAARLGWFDWINDPTTGTPARPERYRWNVSAYGGDYYVSIIDLEAMQ